MPTVVPFREEPDRESPAAKGFESLVHEPIPRSAKSTPTPFQTEAFLLLIDFHSTV